MKTPLHELAVLIIGGGEVASAVAHRLYRAHFKVCITEIGQPLAVSRGTTYSEAVFDSSKTIEGVTAELTPAKAADIRSSWRRGIIPLVLDPAGTVRNIVNPDVLIDATMRKIDTGVRRADAPLVIGSGVGFNAGQNVHAVIESNNSNSLGRVIWNGPAEANTGLPVRIGGLDTGRVVWADQPGLFTSARQIGDVVAAGDIIARLNDISLAAPVAGILRGLIRSGVNVRKGDKLIEIDPVNDKSVCYVIRDKMRAIAGGVLEAILYTYNSGTE